VRPRAGAASLHPLPQLMSMILEAPFDLAPRIVELDRLLQAPAWFVGMHFNDPRSVKLACLV